MSLTDLLNKQTLLPSESEALVGRDEEIEIPEEHFLNGTPLKKPFPEGLEEAVFAMGCFWGVEKKFWETEGVYTTVVGYVGGITKNPTYKEVCTGFTGHTEAVLVVFDPQKVTYVDLLKIFWEEHDPTQGMRQGNDVGTQYRSGIYYLNTEQEALAKETKEIYQKKLDENGLNKITTELAQNNKFYYAEHYHQQYLGKHPDGYCGLAGTGIKLD